MRTIGKLLLWIANFSTLSSLVGVAFEDLFNILSICNLVTSSNIKKKDSRKHKTAPYHPHRPQ